MPAAAVGEEGFVSFQDHVHLEQNCSRDSRLITHALRVSNVTFPWIRNASVRWISLYIRFVLWIILAMHDSLAWERLQQSWADFRENCLQRSRISKWSTRGQKWDDDETQFLHRSLT